MRFVLIKTSEVEVIKEDFKRKSKKTPRKKVKFKPGEENTLSTKKKASFKKK